MINNNLDFEFVKIYNNKDEFMASGYLKDDIIVKLSFNWEFAKKDDASIDLYGNYLKFNDDSVIKFILVGSFLSNEDGNCFRILKI